jgi:DNA-binding transcriptional LysR family regulator
MDTHFLESFLAVVEHGSIAEAARRLNLTPAAVAQRLRALEGEIGVRLVSRSGRYISATPAGANIVSRAHSLIREVGDLKAVATEDSVAGELRLGVIPTALTGLVPGILAAMTKKYPQLHFYMLPGYSSDLYTRVHDGDLDAAIIVQPTFDIPKTCDWQLLREDPLVLLAPASIGVSDPHKLLAEEPFIRYDRHQWGGRLVDDYLRQIGISPRERFELNSLNAIAVLVDRGLGVSLVPDWPPPWPENLSLSKVPIPSRTHIKRVGLLWRRASVRIRLVHAFRKEAAARIDNRRV